MNPCWCGEPEGISHSHVDYIAETMPMPWEVEAGYQSPKVAMCPCGKYWFQGMDCPHCEREVE